VFLSNGVQATPTDPSFATLYALAANIAQESSDRAPGGPVLIVDVYDAPGDCGLRGTDNMQMRFASSLPHASICAEGNDPIGPSRFIETSSGWQQVNFATPVPIHVEQRRDARRAFPTDPKATLGQNRGVVVEGIRRTFP
jgi:hypothetical protein